MGGEYTCSRSTEPPCCWPSACWATHVFQLRPPFVSRGKSRRAGGRLPIRPSTLWGASAEEPRQLALARTSSDGRFELGSQETLGTDVILYVVAKGGEAAVNKGAGDNPAAALLAVLGNTPPPKVVINEMTTVASVW